MSSPADTISNQLEAEKYVGMTLALISGVLIGISFIITKKGLIDSNKNGGQAGEGYKFMANPLWWAGTVTMIAGETCNFLAYSFAPAILVTPLGAISVMVGAVLSHIFLGERLGKDGIIGCILCILGSLSVILHAPEEATIETVDDVMLHFLRPGFLIYMIAIIIISLYLIYQVGPVYGKSHMLVYITICSLIGSISVMAVKGFAVAVKLTFAGQNQFDRLSSWVFGLTVLFCALTQVNYFNKALDLFSTNRVTPIYYVFFTSATIVASVILSQGVKKSSPIEMLSVLVGFVTIFIGVFMVNDAKATNNHLIDKIASARNSSYQAQLGYKVSASSEFVPLTNFDEVVNVSQDDDELTGEKKYQE